MNAALIAFGLAFLGFTIRRLVHANGLYEKTRQEAEGLGLLENASIEDPAPGPTDQELRMDARTCNSLVMA
jgi:hypothetical protein